MRARLIQAMASFAALGLFGVASNAWIAPTWAQIRATEPTLRLEELDAGLEGGVIVGLLGGFRALVADLLWLETNNQWEQLDLPATQTLIHAVTSVDPRPLFFWINGARIISTDMPVWRIEMLERSGPVSADERIRINREQAGIALRLLDRALAHHPHHPLLYLEQGNIHHRRLGDTEAAARLYRLASEQPGAPYYAARIYAEFLKQLGRVAEAHEWLCRLHPTLPRDDPLALAGDVLARIRDLEDALGMPAAQRYRPLEPSRSDDPTR